MPPDSSCPPFCYPTAHMTNFVKLQTFSVVLVLWLQVNAHLCSTTTVHQLDRGHKPPRQLELQLAG